MTPNPTVTGQHGLGAPGAASGTAAPPAGTAGPPAPARRHLRLHVAALLLLGTCVAVAVGYDVVVQWQQHRSHAALMVAGQHLGHTRSALAETTSALDSTTASRNSRRLAATRTAGEITNARQDLGKASTTDYFQTLDIAALHTCLSGVSSAVDDIGGADLQGAVNAITGSSAACLSLDGSSGGLAYPFDFPDPFVLTVGDEYYAFATNAAAGNIQIIQSSDLSHWQTVGDALPHLAEWAQPGATWAPSVIQRGGTYVLYYSAVYGTSGEQCISEATATQPQGPYVDSSLWPIVCQLDLGGSIDPSPFVDTDGTPFLTWKSQGANGQPATLWSQQLTADGTALVPGAPSPLLQPSQSWQHGYIEGPSMVVAGGQHVLLYSGSDWKTASYAIAAARCSGPLGPCTDISSQPLLASGDSFLGPGGPSAFSDSQGNLWMAFHAWLPGRVGTPHSRPLFLRRISLSSGSVQIDP